MHEASLYSLASIHHLTICLANFPVYMDQSSHNRCAFSRQICFIDHNFCIHLFQAQFCALTVINETPEHQTQTWLVTLWAGVRFCSCIDCRRVIRNFLSSPSWVEIWKEERRWASFFKLNLVCSHLSNHIDSKYSSLYVGMSHIFNLLL